MVVLFRPLATINRKPRQTRKEAAAAADSGAEVWLVRVVTFLIHPR